MMRLAGIRRCSAALAATPSWTPRGPDRPPLAFEPNALLSGFRFVRSHHFTELSIVAHEFRHEKTQCQYFHIDSADTNNAFCVGFCTPAHNSKGTTHVLEHTVLCGSKKFPVRDPFFAMLRRSLSTFMNAMTGADYTLYPFATVNAQDFSNLLDVYLDSVFNPLLRRDDFRQEGQRLELRSPESEEEGTGAEARTSVEPPHAGSAGGSQEAPAARLKFNGVVYNEMRGVVSEPGTHFTHQLMRTMLPGTHYEHVSGGHPVDIVDLTYEELVAYHQTHYHPSNSIIMTYGDLPPASHMGKISAYLERFQRTDRVPIPTLAKDKRFAEVQRVTLDGPLDVMGNPQRQMRATVSIGVPDEVNRTLSDVVNFAVLDQLLSSGPSSPLYKSLILSQLGSRFAPMNGYAYYLSSPIVSYGVEGLNEEDPEIVRKVEETVTATLKQVATEGFDQRRVDSVVFQEELTQKHRSANYGIGLLTTACAMGLTRPQLHPLDFVNWVPHLLSIVRDPKGTVLPLVSTLLASKHRALLTVKPSKTFLEDMQQKISDKEVMASVALSPTDVENLKQENKAWLARVRQTQDFSVLPTLRVSDIPKKGFVEPAVRPHSSMQGVYTIAYPTNGLVYVHGLIPFSPSVVQALENASQAMLMLPTLALSSADVTTTQQLYLPLLHSLLGKTGAAHLSDEELSILMDLTCGGISFGAVLEPRVTSPTAFAAGTSWSFYTTFEKLPKALDLLQIILAAPRADAACGEVRRCVQSKVKARCASRLQSLQRNGNAYAVSHAAARCSALGFIKEVWGGVAQNNFCASVLHDLQGEAAASPPASSPNTTETALTSIVNRYKTFTEDVRRQVPNSLVWATCEADVMDEVAAQLALFKNRFQDQGQGQGPPVDPWIISVPTAHEKVALPSTTSSSSPSLPDVCTVELPIDTSFVGTVIPNNLARLSREQQALRVTCSLVKNEFLHRKVREEGGAYGSSCSPFVHGAAGGVTLSSYRDPSPEKTVSAFAAVADWLSEAGQTTNSHSSSTAAAAFLTQSMLDSAKLSLFSTIDAPYSADSFGSALLLTGSTDEIRQEVREMLLGVELRDVRRSAEYFGTTAAITTTTTTTSGSRAASTTTVLKPAAQSSSGAQVGGQHESEEGRAAN